MFLAKTVAQYTNKYSQKRPGWSNHTARGSGEGHCSQHYCIISTVEAIETSTITVKSVP